MRQVSIYSLGKETRAYAGEYHEFHSMDFDRMQPLSDGEVALPVVEVRREPVHHLVRVEDGNEKERYIVIEPNLRELLEAPFLEQVKAANEKAEFANRVAIKANMRMASFLEKPWYKRLWLAVFNSQSL